PNVFSHTQSGWAEFKYRSALLTEAPAWVAPQPLLAGASFLAFRSHDRRQQPLRDPTRPRRSRAQARPHDGRATSPHSHRLLGTPVQSSEEVLKAPKSKILA